MQKILVCKDKYLSTDLHLCEGVPVGSLHEDGNRSRVFALLNEGELVFTQDVFVDDSSISKARFVQVLNTVHGLATACQSQALHVTALGTSESQNAFLGEHVQ